MRSRSAALRYSFGLPLSEALRYSFGAPIQTLLSGRSLSLSFHPLAKRPPALSGARHSTTLWNLPPMASQASLLLQKQLKDLCKNPVDGFSAGLEDENNIFRWSITVIGPPDTLYEGGFFNAIMTFPADYPNSPPVVRFTSEIWHPNVYPDGRVCISILHPPGDDPSGYELASERWTPVHTVESIMLSIISMLSSPNDESPANVEAAKEWRESKDEFRRKVSRCVRKSQEML